MRLPRLRPTRRRGPALLPRRRGAAAALLLLGIAAGFLATLILAAALTAGRLEASWSEAAVQPATLQITVPEAEIEAQARAALAVLRDTPGVTGVRVVGLDEQRALLAPWVGTAALDALPLPLLIEVAVTPALDRAGLDRRLAAEAPGAVYDDHGAWRRPLARHARGLRTLAYVCLGLTGMVFAIAASAQAGSRLAAEAEAVRTLQLIGAPQRVLARALARGPVLWATAGAAFGTAVGAGLLARLPAESEAGFFLVAVAPVGWRWALLALVPVAAAATAWLAARAALARHLRGPG